MPRVLTLSENFGGTFHAYDEAGIIERGRQLKEAFAWADFQEYFAVKALPNLRILRILLNDLGFGFDCSSVPELRMVREIGARASDIMFTSNNTKRGEFDEAIGHGGCILNLDDLRFTRKDRVRRMPQLVCFRYNPGQRRTTSNEIIGNPEEAKYGVPHHHIVEAYRLAMKRGARRFGIHTMIVSNERDYRFMVETVRMLLEVVEMLSAELGIERFEFINIGGGLGIPYRPEQDDFNLEALSIETRRLFEEFQGRRGYMPKLFMESGRWMTGPFGALVTPCINRMAKYIEIAGVEASMSDLMRPGMYGSESETAQHQITVLDKEGRIKIAPLVKIKVVGALCEGNDVFAYRELPDVEEGDTIVIHDTGAHGWAMGFQYNGRLRHAEVLIHSDGKAEPIRRHEMYEDYMCTQRF